MLPTPKKPDVPMKTMKLRVYVECYSDCEIEVPADMDLKTAFEYAKDNIDIIPLGELNYIPDSDELDDADLDNDAHTYFVDDVTPKL